MIMESVLQAAQPHLAGKTVTRAIVGISMIGCQLSDGTVGVSYTLRDSLPNGCSVFPMVQEVEGKPAEEIAQWTAWGKDDVLRGIGAAVLNAASHSLDIPDDDSPTPFGLSIQKTDIVGMVGYIRPVALQLQEMAAELRIFDHGLYLTGEKEGIYPVEQQGELLPQCDVVILSGTTAVNGTLDGLLPMCRKAGEIVLAGSSTPMFPQGFAGTKVTRLAGAWWKADKAGEIFKVISLAGGIRQLSPYRMMKNALV